MKKLLLLSVAGIFAATFVVCRGVADEPNAVRAFMRAKLDHSKKILEGLTTDNLEEVAKDSQELAMLSQASNWQVLQTEDYLQHSREFRRAANALTQAAKDKNLDGATLAYVSVTMSCVNCHKYVRGIRMADARPSK
ncbi:MAG: cytochrome c [Planctomycetes bacterium]|nr:cytochrome c [Planctomycetota bacterium]